MSGSFLRLRKVVSWFCILLIVSDLGLGLWAGRNSRWFFGKPWSEYLGQLTDDLTRWTGRVVWAIAIIVAARKAFFGGKRSDPVSLDKIFAALATGIRQSLPLRLIISVPMLMMLLVASGLLIVAVQPDFAYFPPPSAILVTADDKEIYAVDEAEGRVAVFENIPINGGSLKRKNLIDLNRSSSPAHPEKLAISPSGKTIYVSDPAADEVTVIDRGNYDIVARISVAPIGRTPRWIVFTPEGDKAYVSNEGPVPQGSIAVVNTQKHAISGNIRGVNCPEGLAIHPNTHRLYVSSQCGSYGADPVFSVDTLTDRVVNQETIPEMAVGSGIALAARHHKLYVARANFPYGDSTPAQPKAPLSIIDLRSQKVLRTTGLHMSVNFVVVTPDEEYALVSNGEWISFFDTQTDKNVKDLYVGPGLLGIAVSKERSVYLLFPALRIQMFGLNGLLPRRDLTRY